MLRISCVLLALFCVVSNGAKLPQASRPTPLKAGDTEIIVEEIDGFRMPAVMPMKEPSSSNDKTGGIIIEDQVMGKIGNNAPEMPGGVQLSNPSSSDVKKGNIVEENEGVRKSENNEPGMGLPTSGSSSDAGKRNFVIEDDLIYRNGPKNNAPGIPIRVPKSGGGGLKPRSKKNLFQNVAAPKTA